MTSYEIVRRAVEFERPERIAIRFGALGVDDTYGVASARRAGGSRGSRMRMSGVACGTSRRRGAGSSTWGSRKATR